MYDIGIQLDPATQSGLTASALVKLPNGTVAATVALTETPAGSAYYSNTANITGLAAADNYSISVDAGGKMMGASQSPFRWDGTNEIAKVAATIAAGDSADAATALTNQTAIEAAIATLAANAGGLTGPQAAILAALGVAFPASTKPLGQPGGPTKAQGG